MRFTCFIRQQRSFFCAGGAAPSSSTITADISHKMRARSIAPSSVDGKEASCRLREAPLPQQHRLHLASSSVAQPHPAVYPRPTLVHESTATRFFSALISRRTPKQVAASSTSPKSAEEKRMLHRRTKQERHGVLVDGKAQEKEGRFVFLWVPTSLPRFFCKCCLFLVRFGVALLLIALYCFVLWIYIFLSFIFFHPHLQPPLYWRAHRKQDTD
jgi:hypothetical protein